MAEEQEIGTVDHYFSKISVGTIKLSDALKVGDTIHIKGHSEDFTQTVDSMRIEFTDVKEASAGQTVGIKVAQKVHPNDKVYKVVG